MKQDQTCPHCLITEAAGSYCTKCYRPTQHEWVHAPRRTGNPRFRPSPQPPARS